MISLNSINLGSINLGGMNTSEIKLGYPSSGCPVPGLKGLQGLYMGKGLTNEMMSRDPVWRDKSGKGNHIALKNFGWKLQSGVGMYAHDFSNKWGLFHSSNSLLHSTSIVLKSGTGNWGVKIDKGVGNIVNFKAKLIVEGLDKLDDIKLYFGKFDLNPGVVAMEELHEGLNAIDVDIPSAYGWYGFGFKQTIENANVKITLLPYAYDGAICFDGVDDFGICETFPVFTKEKGYTIMALRKWISRDGQFESLVSNVDVWGMGKAAFVVEYKNNTDMAISFDATTSIHLPAMLSYQTSTDYNGQTLRVGESLSTNVVLVGKTAKTKFDRYSNFALYALAIFDHDTTAEERQPVIDYWKKEFPELFPDQAWTVMGKTNSDADRATIKNITGNGNDLVLTNFAFAENSGYGKWPFYINTSKLAAIGQPYGSLHFEKDGDYATIISNSMNSVAFSFTVRGLSEGTSFAIRAVNRDNGDTVLKYNNITVDGVYRFSYENTDRSFYLFFYNGSRSLMPKGDFYVDILQDPNYEGYLVTDGVDDQIISGDINFGDNWTIVGDWFFMKKEYKACGLVSASNFYVYNNTSNGGIMIYIKRPQAPDALNGVTRLKAICSDGRVYDEYWNEIKLNSGTINNVAPIRIGYQNAHHTQTAFKNLGIYNNTIMNKEQCIRSYNYLQTIKNN